MFFLKKASIKTRAMIDVSFIILFVGLVLFVTAYRSGKQTFQNQVINDLEILVNVRKDQVNSFLDSIKNRVVDFSSDGFIQNSVLDIERGNQSQSALKTYLNNQKSHWITLLME